MYCLPSDDWLNIIQLMFRKNHFIFTKIDPFQGKYIAIAWNQLTAAFSSHFVTIISTRQPDPAMTYAVAIAICRQESAQRRYQKQFLSFCPLS